ncbi:MAG: OmpA family protein [Bacteroidia bacterium]|nr:OmpA family protein [Bacteroidia bacterium]
MKKLLLFFSIAWIYGSAQAQSGLKPDEKNGLISVTVTDYKGIARAGDEIIFIGQKTQKKISGISDAEGKLDLLLPKGDTYRILIASIGEQKEYSQVRVPDEPGEYSGWVKIKYELPASITLQNVLFETGSATLSASSNKSLDELAAFMKRKTTMEIEVAGHTDNVGNAESNLALSQKRAEAVRNYLVAKSIHPSRVKAKGYGQESPVADNGTDAGRRMNRRTEIHILKQ